MRLKKPKPVVLLIAILIGVFAQTNLARAETAILAGGRFWCVESDFESVKGVTSVVSGYTGGDAEKPNV